MKKLSDRQRRRPANFFIGAQPVSEGYQPSIYEWICGAATSELALRVAGNARCSRACENKPHTIGKKMAIQSGVGCPAGVGDALCCLELHLARDQNWITRSPAEFIRADSCSHRDHGAVSCL